MALMDEVRKIADENNEATKSDFQRVDKILGTIYKDIYKNAYSGNYSIEITTTRKDYPVYEKVLESLRGEGFKTKLKKGFESGRLAIYEVSWKGEK